MRKWLWIQTNWIFVPNYLNVNIFLKNDLLLILKPFTRYMFAINKWWHGFKYICPWESIHKQNRMPWHSEILPTQYDELAELWKNKNDTKNFQIFIIQIFNMSNHWVFWMHSKHKWTQPKKNQSMLLDSGQAYKLLIVSSVHNSELSSCFPSMV